MELSIQLVLAFPLIGALSLAFVGQHRSASWLNILFSLFTFVAAIDLSVGLWKLDTAYLSENQLFYIDAFNIYIILLTAFIGMNTAIFSHNYMREEVAMGKLTPVSMRIYHAMYQGFILSMLLALMSNNLGLLWVAIEAATLFTVLLVSLYRTPESIEAAWKYFILCGVGIAQALFGTVLIYFAAAQVIPEPETALLWHTLYQSAAQLEPTVMSIAFVFLLVGYGTKFGLAPLHNWLPDTYSEGPPPVTVVLSGLLLNIALYGLVRVKILVDHSLQTNLPGQLMMGFGLLSLIIAALFIHRQRDIKRLFSYSSIEHVGLMTFALGLGTPLTTFAALLHLLAHSLAKSAIFMIIGYIVHRVGTQAMEKIRGLLHTDPKLGWSFFIGTAAIAGVPPFGIFTGEFLLLIATIKTSPWLGLIVILGITVAFAGLLRHIQPIVYGDASQPAYLPPVELRPQMWLISIHLALVLWLGLSIPPFLAKWFEQATLLISGSSIQGF